MSKAGFSKRLRFWARIIFFVGMMVVGLYFVFDPATPKLYQLSIAFGLLGLLLYYFLAGGGSKDDGLKNPKDDEFDFWQGSSRFPRRSESTEPTESEED